jgi:hypothetical protein
MFLYKLILYFFACICVGRGYKLYKFIVAPWWGYLNSYEGRKEGKWIRVKSGGEFVV